MPSIDHLFAFLAASLLLLIVPGPAVLYIAARSASQGRAAGLVSVAGIATGGLVHVFAAAIGVSALLARSAVAMQYVRWLGAGYLVYLGIQKFREAASANDTPDVRPAPRALWTVFKDGVIVNVFNPKTALFFFAFLPQFVDVNGRSALAQLVFLGLLFVAMALITDSAYALAAARVAQAAKRSGRFSRAASYTSGLVYVGLGIATAANVKAK